MTKRVTITKPALQNTENNLNKRNLLSVRRLLSYPSVWAIVLTQYCNLYYYLPNFRYIM